MTPFLKFKITLKHDNGRKTIKVSARDAETAVRLVMMDENCPLSAITNIQLLSK